MCCTCARIVEVRPSGAVDSVAAVGPHAEREQRRAVACDCITLSNSFTHSLHVPAYSVALVSMPAQMGDVDVR